MFAGRQLPPVLLNVLVARPGRRARGGVTRATHAVRPTRTEELKFCSGFFFLIFAHSAGEHGRIMSKVCLGHVFSVSVFSCPKQNIPPPPHSIPGQAMVVVFAGGQGISVSVFSCPKQNIPPPPPHSIPVAGGQGINDRRSSAPPSHAHARGTLTTSKNDYSRKN